MAALIFHYISLLDNAPNCAQYNENWCTAYVPFTQGNNVLEVREEKVKFMRMNILWSFLTICTYPYSTFKKRNISIQSLNFSKTFSFLFYVCLCIHHMNRIKKLIYVQVVINICADDFWQELFYIICIPISLFFKENECE